MVAAGGPGVVSGSSRATPSPARPGRSRGERDLLDAERPGPIVSQPGPAWPDPDIGKVRLLRAFPAGRELLEVDPQAPIAGGLGRHIGHSLRLHGDRFAAAHDQGYQRETEE